MGWVGLVGGFAAAGAAHAACLQPAGDVDASGAATIVDVQCGILAVLWDLAGQADPLPPCAGGDPARADANCDGGASVADVQLLTAYALAAAVDPLLDADQDGCPDACAAPACAADADCDDGLACTADQCDAAGACHWASLCDPGGACSTTNGLCYACDPPVMGFEDPAFPSPAGADGTAIVYTSLGAAKLPFAWEGVLFDVSDHALIRAFAGITGDPTDYRYLGFIGLDHRDIWLTFPYPIDALAFDVRQYLNWYTATALFAVEDGAGTTVATFPGSPSNANPNRVEVTFDPPTAFVVIKHVAGDGTLATGMGLDNLVYGGPTCP